ncbi:MAG: ABC transporter permease [Alphaproteobacteria bacterium]
MTDEDHNPALTRPLARTVSFGVKLSAFLLCLIAIMAVIAFFWTPYDSQNMAIGARYQLPSARHLLGTDHYGRDILSLVMLGARYSLGIALLSIGGACIIGGALGMLLAGNHGAFAKFMMRTNDVIFAFPALLTAIMLAAIWGAGKMNIILAIGLFAIPIFTRIAKASSEDFLHRPFVMAAKMAGLTHFQILWRHILPNITGFIAIHIALQLGIAILIEAGLSYLGFGVPPPQPSWGRMLAESQTYLYKAPHIAIIYGLFIVICVACFNVIAEGLRRKMTARSSKF